MTWAAPIMRAHWAAINPIGPAPNTTTEIWWNDSLGNAFRPRQEGKYVSVTTDDDGAFRFELVMPYRLIPPSAQGAQYHRVEARQLSALGRLMVGDPLKLTLARMAETIFMGMMATLFGIIFAIPVSFLASRNLMSHSWATLLIYYITRTILNIIRAIEPLIWALIAVVWVGLGPFAGIIARAPSFDTSLLFWEGERKRDLPSLKEQLAAHGSTLIIIGPEGGFAAAEVENAVSAGVTTVSLGSQILRVETACLAALAICQYESGGFAAGYS